MIQLSFLPRRQKVHLCFWGWLRIVPQLASFIIIYWLHHEEQQFDVLFSFLNLDGEKKIKIKLVLF